MYYTQRLKELREKNELTQEQVAMKINIKREQYRRYEIGINEIKASHIIKFAKLYNVSTDYILGLTDNPEPNYRVNNKIKNQIGINIGTANMS